MTLLTSYFVSKKEDLKNTRDAILSLSRGKSLNGSPVFDLWIYRNGQITYNGIENVEKVGIHNTYIPLDIVKKINDYVSNISPLETGDTKGRDNPLTILKYNNRKIVFQSSKTKGNLQELNALLENIASSI